eukprot:Phypoly_transcript_00244.p2 GENE.Phypoly_transcript_00244~~Phypoly_transcript_00244.p2  ORF type:complete len:542 (-),score=88.90 Phypoly_transcript_00244:156-1781(-)
MDTTSTLLSFSPTSLSPYFHGFFPPPNPNSLIWNSLGPIGNYQLSLSDFTSHVDINQPRTKPPPPPPSPPTKFIPALWNMALDLVNTNCATITHLPPTGNFFIKPKNNSTKLRAIFNGKFANSLFPFLPTHYSLPNFNSLKQFLRSNQSIFFHRTDIANFYWSFILPPSHSSSFIFSLFSPTGKITNFALTRPPFGWDFIPTISNTIMHTHLDPFNSPTFKSLIYVDDALSFSLVSSSHCHSITNKIRNSLTNSNFVIHPPGSDKTSALPETTTHFIGKNISSGTSPSITNNATTASTTLFYSIVASAMPLSPKQIQCIAGSFQWSTIHNFLAHPFFYTLHCYSLLPTYRRINLSCGTRAALIKAHLLSNLPWTPNDLTISFPPPNTPLFFCDASVIDKSASCVYLSLTGAPQYIRWVIPPTFCSSQQSAELYALVRSFSFAISLFPSICLISDSTSSLYSASSFTSGAHQPIRAKLLRILANAVSKLTSPCHLLWTPSIHNPADFPSRSLPFTNHPLPYFPLPSPLTLTLTYSSFPPAQQ